MTFLCSMVSIEVAAFTHVSNAPMSRTPACSEKYVHESDPSACIAPDIPETLLCEYRVTQLCTVVMGTAFATGTLRHTIN